MWVVPNAEGKVLGILGFGPNDSENDGNVGFATDKTYTFDPNNRAVAGKIDLIGVMEHEISEVMGRGYGLNQNGFYIPYDLFRFTAPGVRDFGLTDSDVASVYFSVDNGATALKFFYTNYIMGDVQDWQSSTPPDSFDAFVSAGHQLAYSYADAATLDILGYNSPVVTAPRLSGTRLTNGTIQITFTNGSNAFFSVRSATNITIAATNWTVARTDPTKPRRVITSSSIFRRPTSSDFTGSVHREPLIARKPGAPLDLLAKSDNFP